MPIQGLQGVWTLRSNGSQQYSPQEYAMPLQAPSNSLDTIVQVGSYDSASSPWLLGCPPGLHAHPMHAQMQQEGNRFVWSLFGKGPTALFCLLTCASPGGGGLLPVQGLLHTQRSRGTPSWLHAPDRRARLRQAGVRAYPAILLPLSACVLVYLLCPIDLPACLLVAALEAWLRTCSTTAQPLRVHRK